MPKVSIFRREKKGLNSPYLEIGLLYFTGILWGLKKNIILSLTSAIAKFG
jgi:hypothetical protein